MRLQLVQWTRFNTQPPEGGCLTKTPSMSSGGSVSTHSRPKAAAKAESALSGLEAVSTHSRPKAAACHAHGTMA